MPFTLRPYRRLSMLCVGKGETMKNFTQPFKSFFTITNSGRPAIRSNYNDSGWNRGPAPGTCKTDSGGNDVRQG